MMRYYGQGQGCGIKRSISMMQEEAALGCRNPCCTNLAEFIQGIT